MGKIVGRWLLFVVGMFLSVTANAQDKPEMADAMRSNGKIYVVVAVCLTILIGLFIYVYLIDRKISKLEKE
jgi:purine-cytosine permease-like protein